MSGARSRFDRGPENPLHGPAGAPAVSVSAQGRQGIRRRAGRRGIGRRARVRTGRSRIGRRPRRRGDFGPPLYDDHGPGLPRQQLAEPRGHGCAVHAAAAGEVAGRPAAAGAASRAKDAQCAGAAPPGAAVLGAGRVAQPAARPVTPSSRCRTLSSVAMQKVEGSSPFSRFSEKPCYSQGCSVSEVRRVNVLGLGRTNRADQPGGPICKLARGSNGHSPSASQTIPTATRPIGTMREATMGSPNRIIPPMAAPTAPVPVHTA